MSLRAFFREFSSLSNAPNGVSEIRGLVLQLAIRGQLETQNPNDDPASSLLYRIERSRTRRIKARIRTTKPLPAIQSNEIPFSIPQSWEWIRLGEIGDWGAGATPNRKEARYYGGDIRWFKSGELNDGSIRESEERITQVALKECSLRLNQPGDVLIAMYGATIGKLAILETEATTNQAVCACTCFGGFDNRYLFLLLRSYKKHFSARGAGGAQPNISREKIIHTVAPLPPLEEQKRIVTRVDELMVLCDELIERQEAEHASRVRLNAAVLAPLNKAASLTRQEFKQATQRLVDTFDTLYDSIDTVDKLRATILQIAVQGKIVPQDPNEEPASELFRRINAKRNALIDQAAMKKSRLLPAIHHNELPFPVPETWQWVRLNDVFDVRDGTHDTPKYVDAGFPLVTSKNLYTGVLNLSDVKYIAEADHIKISERSRVEKDDVLFAMIGSIGNPVIVQTETEFSIKNVALFKYYSRELSEPMYLHLYLSNVAERMRQQSTGGVQSFVSLGFLRKYLFPLPPLAEQKRIVAKVNQLMSLCDELEAKLRQAEADSEKLMNAAVEHVLDSVRDVSRTGEEVFA